MIGLDGIGAEDVKCVQRTIDSSVLLTFVDESIAGSVVELDVIIVNGMPRLVSYAYSRKIFVKLFYLPFEVDNADVKMAISEFGHVFGIRQDKLQSFPNIESGLRTVTMTLKSSIPSFVRVGGYEVKVWYRRRRSHQ